MKISTWLGSVLTALLMVFGAGAPAQTAGTYQPLVVTGKLGGGYGPGGGIIRVVANSTNVIASGLASTNTASQPGSATFLSGHGVCHKCESGCARGDASGDCAEKCQHGG